MQKFIGVLLVGLLGLTLLLTGCGSGGGGGGGDGQDQVGAFVLDESQLNDPDSRLQ